MIVFPVSLEAKTMRQLSTDNKGKTVTVCCILFSKRKRSNWSSTSLAEVRIYIAMSENFAKCNFIMIDIENYTYTETESLLPRLTKAV